MATDAAVLTATYKKLVRECEMARLFCEAKLDGPLLDCVHRIRTVIKRVNNLLAASPSAAALSQLVAANSAAAEAVRHAEANRSPEWFGKALDIVLELKNLFQGADKSSNAAEAGESIHASALNSGAKRNGSIGEGRPRVSVLIPTYNMSRTLWRAIESALAQKLDDGFEIIVVDDGSTDETKEVLKLYDGRIRTVLMPQNRGLAAARNAGIAAAAGEFVAFLDADDEFLPGRLSQSIAAFDAAPDVVLAYSDMLLVDGAGLMIAPSLAPALCSVDVMRAPSIDDLFRQWWPILPSAVTVRKETIEKCGRFHEDFKGAAGHEELPVWLSAREMGSFAFIAKALVQYRMSPMLERLERYTGNLGTFRRVMSDRFGARGVNMVHNFAANNAGALVAEGSAALNKRDLPTARRALSCALTYLSEEIAGSDLPSDRGTAQPGQTRQNISANANLSPPRLHALYDAAFYAAQVDGSARSARIVIPLVMDMVRDVASVVDVGCGAGVWLAAFQDAGVKTILGLDGGAAAHSGQLKIDSQHFLAVDLERPFDLPRRYDLCACLEVAEHLAPNVAISFVKNLCDLSDVVVFSAAMPGQGGTGHINERWPSYWAALFLANGYETHDILRPRIWYDQRIDWWYRQNTLVFAKKSARARLAAAHPEPAGPLDIVHPAMFQRFRAVPLPENRQVEAPTRAPATEAVTLLRNSQPHAPAQPGR